MNQLICRLANITVLLFLIMAIVTMIYISGSFVMGWIEEIAKLFDESRGK